MQIQLNQSEEENKEQDHIQPSKQELVKKAKKLLKKPTEAKDEMPKEEQLEKMSEPQLIIFINGYWGFGTGARGGGTKDYWGDETKLGCRQSTKAGRRLQRHVL
ncbi:MAG: hypothetical protein AAF734_04510 [Bacteroidota bacterium]